MNTVVYSNMFFFSIYRTNKEILDLIKRYKPKNNEASRLRILLHGPIGAGKSSFINSVKSVLQGSISIQAPTDATSGTSFTTKVWTTIDCDDSEQFIKNFMQFDTFWNMVTWDCWPY